MDARDHRECGASRRPCTQNSDTKARSFARSLARVYSIIDIPRVYDHYDFRCIYSRRFQPHHFVLFPSAVAAAGDSINFMVEKMISNIRIVGNVVNVNARAFESHVEWPEVANARSIYGFCILDYYH